MWLWLTVVIVFVWWQLCGCMACSVSTIVFPLSLESYLLSKPSRKIDCGSLSLKETQLACFTYSDQLVGPFLTLCSSIALDSGFPILSTFEEKNWFPWVEKMMFLFPNKEPLFSYCCAGVWINVNWSRWLWRKKSFDNWQRLAVRCVHRIPNGGSVKSFGSWITR